MNFPRLTLSIFAVAAFSGCGVGQTNLDGELLAEDTLSQDEAALAAQARFQTFVGRDGQFRFHLVVGNGQKVLSSEAYVSSTGAKNGIASVKTNGVNEGRYFLRETSDGSWYFVLVAVNHEIIGASGMYSTQANATRGMATVRRLIKTVVAEEAVSPAAPKFETFKGLDARYYFHVKDGQGEIVLQSQSYTSKASATNGVNSVQANGGNAARYQVLSAADGRYYFVLRAANGEVIGRGSLFDNKEEAQSAVDGLVVILSGHVAR